MSTPLAYFISFRTYGTWLQGDPRGSVDRRHNQFETPKLPEDALMELRHFERMKQPPVTFTIAQRATIERTITEVCAHRNWGLRALNVRTNHVHTVTVASQHTPERVMTDFKAYATRRLLEASLIEKDQKIWSRHGSTQKLWHPQALAAAIDYVLTRQD